MFRTKNADSYGYQRTFFSGNSAQDTVDELSVGLFEPNARTSNVEIFAVEERRIRGIMQRFGIRFDEALLGYDWVRLSRIMMQLRGVVYTHMPVVLPDILDGNAPASFVEYTPLPERLTLPEDLDVFMTSMNTIRYVKERPEWATRYGLFNQRLQGQSFTEENGQDAVRTGFWMLPREIVDIVFAADETLARRAFAIFEQVQFAEGHDGLFHMPIHGIHSSEPHYAPLRAWSDMLYDVPAEIRYPHGGEIPNYEMAAVRSHRMVFERAVQQNPKITDHLINSFLLFEETVLALADKIPNDQQRRDVVKYMMSLYKTPFFHVIPPDTEDHRVRSLIARHPSIALNNRFMKAIHDHDTVSTTRGEMSVAGVIQSFRELVEPYAQRLGIDPGPTENSGNTMASSAERASM